MGKAADSGIYNIVMGTAGHIDHGKSAIVQHLTGIHPDRLPAEQERGLTIDLGFAPMLLSGGQTNHNRHLVMNTHAARDRIQPTWPVSPLS